MTSSGTPGGSRLPRRSRDRRAALSALALLLVVLGALGSALVVYRSGHRSDVLVAARDIKAGDRIRSSDLRTARVASDSERSTEKASLRGDVIGSYATTGIPAGTLVNPAMFQLGNVIPKDGVVVGVTLAQEQRPATEVDTGDVVRAFFVPTDTSSGTTAPTGPVLVDAARVVDVSQGSSDTGSSLTVSLLVDKTDASALVAPASAGQVALAELPPTVNPPIDFQKSS